MARINIDDGLYRDPRFLNLMIKVGCQYKAVGLIVSAWGLAQKHFLDEGNERLIPINEWLSPDYDTLIEFGFAEKRSLGVYLKGSEKQFAWLLQCSKAGKSKGKTSNPSTATVGHGPVRRTSSGVNRSLIGLEPLTPTLTLTPTPTLKEHKNSKGEILKNLEQHASHGVVPNAKRGLELNQGLVLENTTTSKAGEFIAAYVAAFQERYGKPNRPDLRGKVQGLVKRFVKDYPTGQAILLIQTYLQMKGHRGWFETKHHDFGTFLENLNVVSVALTKGSETDLTAPPDLDWEKVFGGDS